jgi:hypothetical protein
MKLNELKYINGNSNCSAGKNINTAKKNSSEEALLS